MDLDTRLSDAEAFNLLGRAAAVITSYSIHYTKLYETMRGFLCQPSAVQTGTPRNNFV